MKIKLWISNKLELRWNEWPEKEFWPEGTEKYEDNARAIEKAKAESIPVDGGTIPGSLTHALMTAEPDTFIEYAGEVEVVWQWFHNGVGSSMRWETDTDDVCWRMSNAGKQTRQLARLKKADNSAHGEVVPINQHVAIGWQQKFGLNH